MAATGAYVIGSLVTAAFTQAITPKPKGSEINISNPTTPPAPTDATPNPAGDVAAMARKKVSGAQGIQDTILTGPAGLGVIGAANTNKKTLLGY
jgi:hypothetical protein